jgi:hypothetical protein
MAMRAAAAKALATGMIAATIVAALILIAWPQRSALPVDQAGGRNTPIAGRAISVGVIGFPNVGLVRSLEPSVRKEALEKTRDPVVVARQMPVDIAALWNAASSPDAHAARPGARAIEEHPLLPGRPIAFVSELRAVSSMPISNQEPSRRGGALTRAMGTTAGAFRIAGTSVAGALKKVF